MTTRQVSADEARAMVAAATPGPWGVYAQERQLNETGRAQFPDGCAPIVERRIGTAWVHPQLHGPAPVVTTSTGPFHDPPTTVEVSDADATLIAAAPDLAHTVVALHDRVATLAAERDALAAQLDALRGAVRAYLVAEERNGRGCTPYESAALDALLGAAGAGGDQ